MTEKKAGSLEVVRDALLGYRQFVDKTTVEDWATLACSFKNIIDDESLPFDKTLVPLCTVLANNHSDENLEGCNECEDFIRCDFKEERKSTSFMSFNLGLLYGFALAKLLFLGNK